MIKLYRRVDGALHYHEAWESDGEIIEHWGPVGERGQQRNHRIRSGQSEDKALEATLADARAGGFEELGEDELIPIFIEYSIEGMGTGQDVQKRHALENRMNETLGWTGLGHCDGGSIGSGTMEVCCLVADVDVARRVIAADLGVSEFADYSRIYEE